MKILLNGKQIRQDPTVFCLDCIMHRYAPIHCLASKFRLTYQICDGGYVYENSI